MSDEKSSNQTVAAPSPEHGSLFKRGLTGLGQMLKAFGRALLSSF